MGQWVVGGVGRGGVVICVHSVQFVMAVERFIVSRMVMLSRLFILSYYYHRFLAEDCGYMPRKSILLLSGIQRHWLGLHSIMRGLHKVMHMSSLFDYVNLK